MNQSKLELSACCWRKARGNACERVTIGLDFTSDWMKNWREFFKPIVCCSWCNTKYFSFPIFPFCRIATSSVTRQSKHTWTLSALMLILQNVKWSYSYVTPNLKVRLASQSVSCAVRHPFISLASIYVKGLWLERRETMNLERRTLSLFFIIFFTSLRRNDKKSTSLVVVTIDYSWIGLSVWGFPVSHVW